MSILNEPSFDVRPSHLEERAAIYDMLLTSGMFTKLDADCVDEMFRDAWEPRGQDQDYCWLSCWYAECLVGFACCGLEWSTVGTWDLFWLCVAPEMRGKGVGGALIGEVEARVKTANGRLIVIYTSSTDAYAPARRLYERAGYVRAIAVPDYYADGDDLTVYWKRPG